MADYHLEQLAPRAFEQLGVSLACAVFGADIEVYGAGRDGGREAAWEGRYTGNLVWSQNESRADWTGYTVVQAKHQEFLGQPKDNLNWLKKQIRTEFSDWMNKSSRGAMPNQILFVTNSRLSAQQGVDEIRAFIRDELSKNYGTDDKPKTLKMRGMRDASVWHRDTINTLLDMHQSVRFAYPTILTLGDLVSRIWALPGSVKPEDLAPVILQHAQGALRDEGWVRFQEASETTEKQEIDKVFIDVPVMDDGAERGAIAACLERAEPNLRKSHWRRTRPRHLVITGAPGNGKSTISSFLTQVYRARFVSEEANPEYAQRAVDGIAAALDRLGLPQPSSLRWPIRVDLADMAMNLGQEPGVGPNLMRYLSDVISRRLSITLQPFTLAAWMKAWPTLVVFDGLDEVTTPVYRVRVLEEIEAFVQDADHEDRDLFVVVTTRPTGYTERFMPQHFAQVDLAPLSPRRAISYAAHVTDLRLKDDPSQAQAIKVRFKEAANDETTVHLVRTPLQVLMLTFIIEQSGGSLPVGRHELFYKYYEAVRRREANKNTSLKAVFRDHGELIDDIHERVGLCLHVQSERTLDTQPRLPLSAVEGLVRERLAEMGHTDERSRNHVAQQLLDIATTRLVLLVGSENDSVTFEVRSLQELMAARALTQGSDDDMTRNLSIVGPGPHWRNTWLLAAGRLVSDGDHRRELVLDLLESIDRGPHWPGGWLCPVGPDLAAHVLMDGMVASKPSLLRKVVHVSLRCLDGPMPLDVDAIATGLSTAMQQDASVSSQVRSALRRALSGTPMARTIASALLARGDFGSDIPGQPAKTALAQDPWRDPALSPGTASRIIHQDLLPQLEEFAESDWGDAEVKVREALQHLGGPESEANEQDQETLPSAWSGQAIPVAVDSKEAADLFMYLLDNLSPEAWGVRSYAARAYFLNIGRSAAEGRLTIPYLQHVPPVPDGWNQPVKWDKT